MNKDTKNKKNRGIDVWRSSYLPVIARSECNERRGNLIKFLCHSEGFSPKNLIKLNKKSFLLASSASLRAIRGRILAECGLRPQNDENLNEITTRSANARNDMNAREGSILPLKNFSPFTFHFSRKRAAFTLAEVLITLGIIGVVAAVTMPTLVQNYRKHVVETKLAKFYSIMNQAQQRSIIDNGEFENWELLTSDTDIDKKIKWFNKYFGQYLSGTEIKNKYVLFPDGSAVGLPGVDANLHFKYVINFNDVAKGNLQNGKNAFNFLLKQQNISYDCQTRFNPYHCNINEEKAKNDPYEGCYGNPSVDRYNCARLIQINGWKIPKDYPIKF